MKRKKVKSSAPFKPASSRLQSTSTIPPGWASGNWSGYAIKSTKRGTFHSISGYWIVPRVKPSKNNTFSSAWIGIDGFNNTSLIQTGTESDFENGKAVYYPWWEILPAPETRINLPVSPNDIMFAQITRLSKNRWLILLSNRSKGWIFGLVKRYTGPATSAEWILEAPTVNGSTAKLANYGKILFAKSRINGRNPLLRLRDRGIMIQDDRIVSTPSIPSKTRDRFFVSYGSKMPSPPKCPVKRSKSKPLSIKYVP